MAQEQQVLYQSEIIQNYRSDTLNYDFIANLSVIDTSVTKGDVKIYKSRLNNLIKDLPEKGNSKKRETKRIKKIYDLVHDALFTKYEDIAYFPQIFNEGIYNCVTATAVYAYIFDQIQVPYHVKESPGHVYLIAYPNTYNIQLETTAPVEYGFLSMSDSEIKKVVDQLSKMKLVSKEEIEQKGYQEIYMEYFFGDGDIDKKGLIGMQYYNKAIELYVEEDYESALKFIDKSLIYYPYAPSEYMKKNLSFLILYDSEFDNIETVENFLDIFSELKYEEDFDKHDLNYYLYKIVDNDANDIEFLESSLNVLSQFSDETVRSHCELFLLEDILRKYLKQDDLDKCIFYGKRLLKNNPNSRMAKDGITYAVTNTLITLPLSEQSIKEIEKKEEEFPFLKDNIRIKSFRAFTILKLIEEAYISKKITLGEKYIDDLELIINSTDKTLMVNSEMIAYAYLVSGRYYYRHNIYPKAKHYLSKGLEFSPDNKDLKKHLNWTIEEMN